MLGYVVSWAHALNEYSNFHRLFNGDILANEPVHVRDFVHLLNSDALTSVIGPHFWFAENELLQQFFEFDEDVTPYPLTLFNRYSVRVLLGKCSQDRQLCIKQRLELILIVQ